MAENLSVRELAYRKSDSLEVTLWWVKNSLATYVHVVDHCHQPPLHHSIDTPAGVSPNDLFYHPYAYISDQVTQELEIISGG